MPMSLVFYLNVEYAVGSGVTRIRVYDRRVYICENHQRQNLRLY